jgi:hypothetical protein
MTALRGRSRSRTLRADDALSLLDRPTNGPGSSRLAISANTVHGPQSTSNVVKSGARSLVMVARLARVRRYGPDSCTNLFEKEIMANHSKVHTAAEAQFRKSLKATWKGKKVTTPYEAEARAARNKTARLKELRLAKEAAEKETKTKQGIKD